MELASKEAHIDNLMDGHLYMNTAGYYHGLPVEQGNPLETSLVCGMNIHANWLLPIYCTFTVRGSDIANNTIVISKRIIEGLRCADG